MISGKGGSGKTTVVSSLTRLFQNKVLADNDVDAADLHLLLLLTTYEAHDFVGGKAYSIDTDACTGCGRWAENCHFAALLADGPANEFTGRSYGTDELACEGCVLCGFVRPVGAIDSHTNITERWFVPETRYGSMAHTLLGIADENSGRMVTRVRK